MIKMTRKKYTFLYNDTIEVWVTLDEKSNVWDLKHENNRAVELTVSEMYDLIKSILLEVQEIQEIKTNVSEKAIIVTRETTIEQFCFEYARDLRIR